MAAGLPDLVDYARLAEEAAVLERTYELHDANRALSDLREGRFEGAAVLTISQQS